MKNPKKLIRKLRSDYEYAAEKVLKIITPKGSVPFKFNRMQSVLWADLRDDLIKGNPIRKIYYKGRQMGTSTFVEGYLAWISFFRKYKKSMIVAHKEDSTKELYGKIQFMYKSLPHYIRPKHKINNRDQLYLTDPDPEKIGLESKVVARTAGDEDLARSETLQNLHASEIAFWAYDPKPRMTSAHQTIDYIPGTSIFIESTPNGENYFAELWRRDDFYDRMFICWVADEGYRMEIETDYMDLSDIEGDKYGDEVREREYIIHELKNWYPEYKEDEEWLKHESLCRLKWRRWMIDNECEGDVYEFRKEYPTHPDHGFSTTGSGVFPAIKLSDWRQYLKKHEPEPQRYRWHDGKEMFYKARYGNLRVYETILPDALYVIGADVARGAEGGDPSAFVLLRVADMLYEVMVYNAITPPNTYANMLNSVGRAANNALLGVEVNDAGGYYVVDQLRKEYHYPSIYRREVGDSRIKKKQMKDGFYMSTAAKDTVVGDLRAAIDDDYILFRDQESLEQLSAYQELPTGRLGVPEPRHDDIVDAWMIARHMARSVHQRRTNKKSKRKYSLDWWVDQIEEEKFDKPHGI